jgi:PAS domain S-box-containing protein
VRALKTGEIVRAEKLVYRRPNQFLAELEVHAGPVRDPHGALVAAVGMAFDVTERTAAERRLRASELQHRTVAERLRAAIDAGSLGLWELDLETQNIRLDATFAAMLGLPAEPVDMPRDDLQSMVHPDDRARAAEVLVGAIAQGGAYSDELHIRTTGGAERWLLIRGAVLTDMRRVVGVVGDVTERRQREDALQAALTARDVLMREADHRIKNSLQLVVSLLNLQMRRVSDRDAKDALAAAASRVGTIADAHLALQRSPDLRAIELDRMLTDLCTRVGALNPAITIRCETHTALSLDADQAIPLGLLTSEVLSNALRHAYPPGVLGEVAVTAATTGGALEMTIADDGRGLPATPAGQGLLATSPSRGLGTTLIAALARQIGATVDTNSRPGAGTAVTVRLPLPDARSAP